MKTLAIITARGGSKRIPRKNIKDFLGMPIIAYSINAAIKSNLFSEVMVSTDDEEIAEIATKYGAKVPFVRSDQNSDDFASTTDVLIEVLEKYQAQNTQFDLACCLYPTAPFVTPDKLTKAYERIVNKNFDSIFPVVHFSYPIQRALKINQNGLMAMFQPENLTKRSQDLEPAYHDAGQFYFFKVAPFLEKKKLWTDNSSVLIVPETEVQDIDTPQDWELAEIKFQWLKQKSQS
ncbi:MAG TPA: pseudaminic acid cytidylyltransferase [Microscillaceae bacterium]|nr:pseudaminic acid cytidylyltransferase [Microscillaceae bacterium]